MEKKYATATAFRMALENRLNNYAKQHGANLHKMRKQVAFDRLLSRLSSSSHNKFLLKGGYAMVLRIDQARTTRDLDLILNTKKPIEEEVQRELMLDALQEVAKKKSEDFFTFVVGEPTMRLEATPDGGYRFPIEAHLGGRLFEKFPVDMVSSTMVIDPVEQVLGHDWLEFAGIEAVSFPAISKEQQFAEKLHAYTLPRGENINSRVKDLIDILLLVQHGNLQTSFLILAIEKVFTFRDTHPIPAELQAPPAEWEIRFNKLANECHVLMSMKEAFGEILSFWKKLGKILF